MKTNGGLIWPPEGTKMQIELSRDWFIINHADASEFDYVLSQLGYSSVEQKYLDEITIHIADGAVEVSVDGPPNGNHRIIGTGCFHTRHDRAFNQKKKE